VFELFSLAPADVETRAPLPIEGVTAVPAPAATAAAPPGPTPDEPSGKRQQASLGLLVFDDGAAFGLDDDYVMGREPEIDESVAAGSARPITLVDPADTVSRVHAEIRLVAADVQLIDRGSTNGTHVWDESRGAWERLEPGLPRVIRPGERGAVGRRTFVYEVVDTPVAATRPMPEVATINPRRDRALVGSTGETFPLDRSYVIGRDPLSDDSVRRALTSPIVIRDDQEISRVHAHVSVTGAAVHVRDAGTVGGTFIAPPGASSWQPVDTEPVELRPGWSLRVGAHVFTFRSEA
jgi:pSer/pThr/pTyr-binding forkhead associated (FHA) protein